MYSSVRKSVLEPWSTPQNLGSDVNTGSNDFLGAISPDGDTLYFTSNRPVDNRGGVDIYVTTRSKHRRH
jgi:Tol biopolymer transport system component